MSRTAVLIGLCIHVLTFVSAMATETTVALPPDVLQAWEKQRSRQTNFQTTYVYSTIANDVKQKHSTLVVKRYADCGLLLRTTEDDQSSRVIVTNSKYSFIAKRNKDAEGWFLTELILEPNAKLRGSPDTVIEECNQLLVSHLMLFDRSIWRALEASMKVEKTEAVAGAPNLLKIYMKHDSTKSPSRKRDPITSGWVVIDKDYDWSITDQLLEGDPYPKQPLHTFATRRELARASNGVVYAKTQTTVIGPADPSVKERVTTVFDNDFVADIALSEGDFSLTAFGLPEPAGHEVKQPYPKYVWWIVVGVVFLVIGVAARQISRRKS